MTKFKVLIVGAGNIGALLDDASKNEVLTHAHACSRISAFKNFAFVDVDQTNLDKAHAIWGKKTYLSFEKAVSDFQPDIISFSTPPCFRLSLVEKISNDLKFVFFEKPLASDLKDVEQIVNIISNKKIPSAVNYSRLFSNDIKALGNAIRENKFGKLIKGTFTYSKGLRNNGSHVLSLLQFFFGELVHWKVLGKSFDFSVLDPNIDLELQYKNQGKIYMLALDETKFSNIECHLFFDSARIVLNQFGHFLQISQTRSDPIYKGYTDFDESAEFIKTDLDQTMLLVYQNILNFLSEKISLTSSLENAVGIERLMNQILIGI